MLESFLGGLFSSLCARRFRKNNSYIKLTQEEEEDAGEGIEFVPEQV